MSIKKLTENDGYSLIETLTSFTVLGIFVALVATLFVKIMFNPSSRQVNKAQFLGQQEIRYCIANYVTSDSSWITPDSLMEINRVVKKIKNYQYHINVSAVKTENYDTLISYNTIYNYFE